MSLKPTKQMVLRSVLAFAVLCAVSASSYYFGARSDSPAATLGTADPAERPDGGRRAAAPSLDGSGALPDGWRPLSPRPRSPFALLASASSLEQAIAAASSEFGADHYRVRRMMAYAKSLCSQPPDPAGSLVLPLPDLSRDWVFEAIADKCLGLDEAALDRDEPVESEPASLLQIQRERGVDSALHAARSALGVESDPLLLTEAALLLWEHGKAPDLASFGLDPASTGPADQMAALTNAVSLASCQEIGGCGQHSWQTLVFCARAGCRPGVGHEQAMRHNLGDVQLRLALGYARWLRSMRTGK